MNKLIRTESEIFHYLKSKDSVYATGWKHAMANEESTYPIGKKFDCIKARYLEGYSNGQFNLIRLEEESNA